jgi:membrane fusion protein, copper/silver efflux system
MRRASYAILLGVFLVGSFLTGSWYSHRESSTNTSTGARKTLYYVDPMHPAYKSDKPGIAPDCGMELVPVYDDGSTGGPGAGASGPPGTLAISAERQQSIGVKVSAVEKKADRRSLRLLGKVAPDENLTYRVTASSEMWIRKVYPPTTGSLVRKDEPLLAFYTTNFLTAAAAYQFALNTLDRAKQARADTSEQMSAINSQIRQAVEALQNLGVSDSQIEQMARTRNVDSYVDIRSPAKGFILVRNATLNQWIASGTELYTIADLSRVWVLAEVFEDEGQLIKPGTRVRVTHPQMGKSFNATVSDILPRFDPQTRTMKVRLETDNPEYVLRPDMFVDLEVPVTRPAAIVVPVDAVVDTGVKKTVYVDKGNGVFEPRKVETGWRAGGQIEIVKGLMPGEKIVVSGTFLIDSESRMKAAAAGIYGETSECPVCGMEVDTTKAKAAALTSEFRGQIYYFCAAEDKVKFDQEPTKYTWNAGKDATTEAGKRLGSVEWDGRQSKEKKSARVGHISAPAPSTGKPSPR